MSRGSVQLGQTIVLSLYCEVLDKSTILNHRDRLFAFLVSCVTGHIYYSATLTSDLDLSRLITGQGGIDQDKLCRHVNPMDCNVLLLAVSERS
jgi:hypothetical protein